MSDITQLTYETPLVDKIMDRFSNQWRSTAQACIARAEELEQAAAELREHAAVLNEAQYLLVDTASTVQFEINARNRAASLALVRPAEEPGERIPVTNRGTTGLRDVMDSVSDNGD
jgi:hypothetical protein